MQDLWIWYTSRQETELQQQVLSSGYDGVEDAVGDWKVRLRLEEGRWKFEGE